MNKILSVLSLIALTLALYAGLFLLGWGLGDLRGFFSEPARAAYIGFVVLMALATPLIIARSVPEGIGDKGREEKHRTRQDIAWNIARPILFILILAMPFCDRRNLLTLPESAPMRWVGLALVVAGFVLITWTTVELGRQYSVYITLQRDHKLITSGPYRYIRHPRYLGVMLVALGMALLFRSWIALLALPFLLALLIFRLTDEEKLLREEFGVQWEEYVSKSWRLVPFIY
jgi:protein-S-isoprenylcysteine O-methyltransferase Ste14